MRRLTTILAALALVVAACGDDDDATAAPDGGDDTVETPPMGPAELSAEDQTGDGTEVTVASVTLPADGFVVVHADADGSAGPVIGHSDLLAAGESTDVVVTLDEPLTATATVWPMAHIDTNVNGAYDFAPPDVTDDGPATFDDGEVAVLPVEVTVEGADDEGAADGGATSDEAATVTISDFAFQPGTIEVAAGATVAWTNDDGVPHTVTAGTPDAVGDAFDEPVDAGETAEITLDETGTFDYFCAIHPTMTGQVVVS